MTKLFFKLKKLLGVCLCLSTGSLFLGCDTPDDILSQSQANDALEQTLEGVTIKTIDHDRFKRTTLITLTDGRTVRIKSVQGGHTMVVLPENTKTEE
jgi:hypothetical protein